MVKLSGSQAIGAGFRVIGKHPFAPLIWGLVFVVLVLGVQLAGYAAVWPDLTAAFRTASDHPPSDHSMLSQNAAMSRIQMLMLPYQLLQIPLTLFSVALVDAAILRAVLEPRNSGSAYLRLGAQELWMMVVSLAACALLVMFTVAVIVAAVVIGFGVRAALHTESNPMVAVVLVLGIIALFLWLAARFSMAFPMTFADRQFRLFESWALTRGHTWKIIGVMLTMFLIVLMIELAIAIVVLGVMFAVAGGSHAGAMTRWAQQPPQVLIGQMAPFMIGGLLLYSAIVGVIHTITIAPFADLYRQLTAERPGPADFGGA